MSIEYPVYVHRGDEHHAHGITLPDFPGCFSAADRWEDIPAMVQEAVEVHCQGEQLPMPSPSAIADLQDRPEYQGGEWLLVSITLAQPEELA